MKESKILIGCSSLDYILIEKLLSKVFQLDYAATYEDFMVLKKAHQYDLFLLDVKFLKTDSFAEARLWDGMPVIGLSSDPFDAREVQLKKMGCCACYVKPIRHELFAPFVKYWVNEYRRKEEN